MNIKDDALISLVSQAIVAQSENVEKMSELVWAGDGTKLGVDWPNISAELCVLHCLTSSIIEAIDNSDLPRISRELRE